MTEADPEAPPDDPQIVARDREVAGDDGAPSEPQSDIPRQAETPAASRWGRIGPLVVVAATVAWCLYELRAETTVAAYLNDSAIHAQMVRFAVDRIREGHLPLTSWYPYLGEGSPQFLHYQSLGATLTGVLGLAIGGNTAFAVVLYLLLATWPIAVYIGARLMGMDRWPASLSALCSPFIVSVLGIGYEQQSYLYLGFGLWSQLFAMWTLPLAWGFSWQAITRRRFVFGAVVFITLTMAFHFLTGYLAIFGVIVMVSVRPSKWRERIRPTVAVALGVVVTSAWFVVPLLRLGTYASINEFLITGADANSYGAKQVLAWLVQGKLFDANRLPVLSILAAIGLVSCLWRCRRDERARALIALLVISLLLFFGRTTFGPLFDILPGNRDLFLRRFLMGVQLSGLLLAGIGMYEIAHGGALALAASRSAPGRLWRALEHGTTRVRRTRAIGGTLILSAAALVILAPAWRQISQTDSQDAYDLAYQQSADFTQGVEIAPLIDTIRRLGGGRVYAGLPVPYGYLGGWGSSFKVGAVAVVKYLAAMDIDEVGYTTRTASLMTDPEVYFDEDDPSDYPLFAVRYLLLPTTMTPPVHATLLERSGPYALWTVSGAGYIQVVDTEGTLTANRANIGAVSEAFVHSDLPGEALYPTVAFAGHPAPAATLAPGTVPLGPPGRTVSEHIDLVDGTASATVTLNRRAVVLLKSSYDPGWRVTVDGHSVATEMIGPAYVGVALSPGRHTVTFTYVSYGGEDWLLLAGGLGVVVLALVPMLRRRRVPGSLTT